MTGHRRGRALARAVVALAAAAALAAGCAGGAGGAGEGRAPDGERSGPGADASVDARAGEGAVALSGTVSRVVDGDTVQVRVRGEDVVVRLVGIDTPETRHPGRGVECWGPEASARAEGLMPPGASVRLQTDPTQDVRDRYGRLLAHVYSGGATGADSVNRRLVAEGMARVYVYDDVPFTHVDAFRRAERTARERGEGLWGAPCNGGTERAAEEPPAAPDRPVGECDPSYRGACVPPYPPDLQCEDVGRPVRVVGPDPHRLDGDGNGFGCEGQG